MAPRLRLPFKPSPKLTIPSHFRCPISLDLMRDPVTLPTGITYDRHSIEKWLESGSNPTCPVTKLPLPGSPDLTPNHTIRKLIQDWCVANRSLGVERIATPRAPLTSSQAADLVSELETSSWQLNRAHALSLINKIKKLAKESEKNRSRISSNGGAAALCLAFARFSADAAAASEALSALVNFFPLDSEACRRIGASEPMRAIVTILSSGDFSSRLNAALVVKEISSAVSVAETEGLIEAIVKLIREPISAKTTKAALLAAYSLISSSKRAISEFVELGLVALLIELLVECDKSTCEKALAVLDAVLGDERGKAAACEHALAVFVLVKKMFRVSEMATEFAVSGLWRMCCSKRGEGFEEEEERRRVAEAALSVGAFQKLLLLLQLGCNEGMKEKASELLRVLNVWRGSGECVESVDFKGIKRNF